MVEAAGRDFSREIALQNALEESYIAVRKEEHSSFFARGYINSHIRKSLHRLRLSYIELYQTQDDSPHRDWLRKTEQSLASFVLPFQSRNKLKIFASAANSVMSLATLPVFAALLTATGLGAWWTEEKTDNCGCHVVAWGTIAATVWIGLTMIGAFRKKRRAFERHNIYEQETRLLTAVGSEPIKEPQLDVLGYFLVALGWLILAVLDVTLPGIFNPDIRGFIEVRWGPFRFPRVWFDLLIFVSVLVRGITVLIASFQRPGAWGRSLESVTSHRAVSEA